MNLATAKILAKKTAPSNTVGAVYVSSDSSVYIGANLTALKEHCKKQKLALYDIAKEKVIYSPRTKK